MTTSAIQLEIEYWDKLYQRQEYVYGTAPNQYLLQHASLLQPGMTVLVAGDGEGRNGVWLASLGVQVVSVERSPWGVAKARRLARRRGVDLTFECCDLLEWDWPREKFDAVIAIYLHLQTRERKNIHQRIVHCLKPGGFLLLEAFRRSQADACRRTGKCLFTSRLLRADFRGFDFLEFFEGAMALNEGCMHQGTPEIVRMLARKLLPDRRKK